MISNYYSKKLAAEKLKACYDVASARVKQYLNAEIDYVCSRVSPGNIILELGCGYGRVLNRLSSCAKTVAGIDTSFASLLYAKEMLSNNKNIFLTQMNAVKTAFPSKTFDVVIGIQNGISAFKVDRQSLIREAIRIAKPGGIVLFSTYSENFLEERLEWFIKQAEHNLVGTIDFELSKKGSIVCKDGFVSEIVSEGEFLKLCAGLEYIPSITEIDNSSLFCEIKVK